MGGHHDRPSGSLAAAAEDAVRTSEAGGTTAPTAQEPTGTDTLSDVLEAVRLTGALFFLVDASTPWAAEAPATAALAPAILPRTHHVISYHLITRGACWCEIAGRPPVPLVAGDVIVIPHGDAYALSSEPGLRSGLTLEETLGWFRQMTTGQLPFVVDEGGGGPERIGVVCGFLGCDASPFNPVLATLPGLLHVPRSRAGEDRLSALIDLAVAEARDRRAGGRSVLLRIGELMFVEVVRRYLSSMRADEAGWLAGLRDPVVGRALALLHETPARSWTLDDLAREAGASRSVLTERFAHLVGQPPMHYLAAWRIQLASRRLADGATKISSVAGEVGYESEAAFSRAFKRLTGVAPAVWRSRQIGSN
jgi:AraC-like DNA-binding protein